MKFIKSALWDFALLVLCYLVLLMRWSFDELKWPFVASIIIFVAIEIAFYYKRHRN